LTQEAWLQGVSFYVDERCLIPRSLIAEVLADGSIDPWLNPDAPNALDLCTGGASLAILVALAYPQLDVQALDISADALAVAAINVQRHGLQERVHLVASDGLENAQGVFDLIVCNPPYVNAQSMALLPLEFQAEPALALAGGHDGMDFMRKLLRVTPSFLKEDGILVLEIGNEFEHFIAAFPHLEFTGLYTSAGDTQVLLITQSALLA
jgi:ribosomal protein L3 glutamine methyltransferase